MPSVPKRKDWQEMKKKYGVPNGAASGINVGDEIDKYWKAKTQKDIGVALANLEVKFAAYLSKIDKKKIAKYPAFEKDFLDNYIGYAHKMSEDLKRYSANKEVYKTELMKFFTAVQKLHDKSTLADAQALRGGPVRGLTAMGKMVKGGVDPKDIDAVLGKIDADALKLDAKSTTEQLQLFVKTTIKRAEDIAKIARKQELVK